MRRALVLVALGCAAAVAGCGNASDASSGGGGGKLSLVAYSTPQEVYPKLIDGFGATSAGQGV
jgi:ABC-type glycerol-3-phosphate transport system substrate-binding protein